MSLARLIVSLDVSEMFSLFDLLYKLFGVDIYSASAKFEPRYAFYLEMRNCYPH